MSQMNYEDDLKALAQLGWGPEVIDRMAAMGMPTGALAQFRDFDKETRQLVLRLLVSPMSDEDNEALRQHPAGKAIAQWLLTLPAYVNASEEDEDEDELSTLHSPPGRLIVVGDGNQTDIGPATPEQIAASDNAVQGFIHIDADGDVVPTGKEQFAGPLRTAWVTE